MIIRMPVSKYLFKILLCQWFVC